MTPNKPLVWVVRIFFGLVLLLTYLTISAEGMRNLFEIASLKLHKTGLWPLTYLGAFQQTRKLDIAHILALTMLVLVWVSWEMLTYYYAAELPLTNTRRIIWASGTVILLCDAILFWLGVYESSMFAGSIFAASVMTILYLGMVIFIACLINILEGRIE